MKKLIARFSGQAAGVAENALVKDIYFAEPFQSLNSQGNFCKRGYNQKGLV
jgi:hypothetical protein